MIYALWLNYLKQVLKMLNIQVYGTQITARQAKSYVKYKK